MICPTCGYSNPPEYSYCANCRAALYEILPQPIHRGRKTWLPVLLVGMVIVACFAVLACSILGAFIVVPNLNASQPTHVVAENTPRAVPTKAAILLASTATLVPTDTPTSAPTVKPTATVPRKLKPSDASDAFKRASLDVVNARQMTSADYGTIPMIADEAMRFFVPSIGDNRGGRIYSFSSNANLLRVKQAAEAVVNSQGAHPWVSVNSNLVLELSGSMSSTLAAQYQKAFNAIR